MKSKIDSCRQPTHRCGVHRKFFPWSTDEFVTYCRKKYNLLQMLGECSIKGTNASFLFINKFFYWEYNAASNYIAGKNKLTLTSDLPHYIATYFSGYQTISIQSMRPPKFAPILSLKCVISGTILQAVAIRIKQIRRAPPKSPSSTKTEENGLIDTSEIFENLYRSVPRDNTGITWVNGANTIIFRSRVCKVRAFIGI